MKKIIISFCILISNLSNAQNSNSNNDNYIVQDSVSIPTKSGITSKHPFEIINYGSGKEVVDETITDAGEPMLIKWYNDSFITIPVWK